MAPRSVDKMIVTIAQFPGVFFDECSGGERTVDQTQHHSGGKQNPDIVEGRVTYSSLTLRKAYEPVKDAPIKSWAALKEQGLDFDVKVIKQPVNAARIPIGQPTEWTAKLQSYNEGDYQAGSSQTDMITITLQPTRRNG